MRSHRRRQPLEHALIVGTIDDLPDLELALGQLPADAYGQVLVEVGPEQHLRPLHAPARVTVHRVAPDPSGEAAALGRAMTAWIAEWVPDEADPSRTVTIWVGAEARATGCAPRLSGGASRA